MEKTINIGDVFITFRGYTKIVYVSKDLILAAVPRLDNFKTQDDKYISELENKQLMVTYFSPHCFPYKHVNIKF